MSMRAKDFNPVSLSLLETLREPEVIQVEPMDVSDSGISLGASDSGIDVCDETSAGLNKAAHLGISIDNVKDCGVSLEDRSAIKIYDSVFELPVQDLPILSDGILRELDGRVYVDKSQPDIPNKILKFLTGPTNE